MKARARYAVDICRARGIAAACEDADRLRVVNGSPAVVKVLDITGVRRQLPIIASNGDPLAPVRREDS